jgi:hypothetical protein
MRPTIDVVGNQFEILYQKALNNQSEPQARPTAFAYALKGLEEATELCIAMAPNAREVGRVHKVFVDKFTRELEKLNPLQEYSEKLQEIRGEFADVSLTLKIALYLWLQETKGMRAPDFSSERLLELWEMEKFKKCIDSQWNINDFGALSRIK